MWRVVLGPRSQLGPRRRPGGAGRSLSSVPPAEQSPGRPALHQPPDGLGVHGLNDHFLSLSLSHPWICPLGSQTHPFLQLG